MGRFFSGGVGSTLPTDALVIHCYNRALDTQWRHTRSRSLGRATASCIVLRMSPHAAYTQRHFDHQPSLSRYTNLNAGL